MRSRVHVWAGLEDPLLQGLLWEGLGVHTLVLRAPDGQTGFERDLSTLRLCADRLVVLESRVRTWALAEPLPSFEAELAALARYRSALAPRALVERLGRRFVPPPEPALWGLFGERPTQQALQAALLHGQALLVLRFAGEWGLSPTLLAPHGVGEAMLRKMGEHIDVIEVTSARALPMW